MPSILNATTTSGLVTSADNSGSLQLQTNNGTTAVTIDTSQNVGIGTTSPAQKIEVKKDQASGTLLQVTNKTASSSATTGIKFENSTSDTSTLELWDSGTVGAATAYGLNLINAGSGGVNLLANNASGTIKFATGGTTERMRITSGGDLLVGTASAAGKFTIVGNGSTASTASIYTKNSSNAYTFVVNDDGSFYTGATPSGAPYNSTTAVAANLVVNSSGGFQRSTSSLKYKTDVQDATHGLAEVMQLRPVTYKGKNDGDTVFGGLIAEEVDAVGLTEFVQYAEDGSPDALAYSQMVSLAFKAIQELKAELDATKAEVQALKGVA